MSLFESEIREATRLLGGIEAGSLSAADAFNIMDKQDPVLNYFIMRFLREKYPASNPASEGVLSRIVEITSTYTDLVTKMKKSETDSLRHWFDDTYEMRDFYSKQDQFVQLVVEKVEG